MSPSRDPGESSAYLVSLDVVGDEGGVEDGSGLLNGVRYCRNSARLNFTLAS